MIGLQDDFSHSTNLKLNLPNVFYSKDNNILSEPLSLMVEFRVSLGSWRLEDTIQIIPVLSAPDTMKTTLSSSVSSSHTIHLVKSLLSNNDQKLKIDSRERNFQDKLFGYVGGPRKIFSQFGLVAHTSQWASLFGWFYKVKQWKLPMLRRVPGAFPGSLRWIPLKVKSEYVQILDLWVQIIFFPLQASWRTGGTSWTLMSSWQK